MIAVILAAGMATRLRPLTDRCPKCLLEVGGKSLLQRSLDALMENGIRMFVVVTGYKGEMIEGFIRDHYQEQTARGDAAFRFIDNKDYATTNNIYSLWLARPEVDGREFLLLDSDLLYDSKLITVMLSQPGAALSVNRHPLGEEEMKVVVDNDHTIVAINKTCNPAEAYGESVGVEKFSAEYSTALFRELRKMIVDEGLSNVFYEKAFERLIPQGHAFRMVDTTDIYSTELDTIEDFDKAKEDNGKL